ncbi:MAG: AAA-like domain-containing protein [Anaerolineales bacterium]|nr:AAA-like domain-containing protein [Anaerolineales bacterium]
MSEGIFYTIGGAIQPGGLYLTRRADTALLDLCRSGTFAYVLAPRQMGKSSLRLRVAGQLQAEGIKPVHIDLNLMGKTQLDADQWYLGLLDEIERNLALDTDALAWWRAQQFGPTRRLVLFFRNVLLAKIGQPVVIFIDEIDTTLGLDFTDDFFTAARAIHDARPTIPQFQRLSFVFIGVATPNELVKDPRRTPFNIGQRVDVTDFTFQEARPLADGLGLPRSQALQVLTWILNWSGGHPYLTQRLCAEIAHNPRSRWSEADVYQVVKRLFLSGDSNSDSNLQFVNDMLIGERTPDLRETLNLYRAIRSNLYSVPDEEQKPVISNLKLSGLVRSKNGVLQVRNPIYAKVFDLNWIEEAEAVDEVGDRREVKRLRALAEAQKRQAEEAQRRAEAERRRAEQEARDAARLRRRAMWLAGALGAVLLAVIVTISFGISAQNAANQRATAQVEALANAATAEANAIQRATAQKQAEENLAIAQHNATLEAEARSEAVANLATAEYRATLESVARGDAVANLATAEYRATQERVARGEADANLVTAQFRATQEAVARGEAETNLATAQYRATQEAIARGQADANLATAQVRATQEAQARGTAVAEATRAFEQQQIAEAKATEAFHNQQTAEAQANARATAQAQAEEQARLATSRQLTAQARSLQDTRVGIALLLVLEANRIMEASQIANTFEVRSSLYDLLLSTPRLTTLREEIVSKAIFSPDKQTLVSWSYEGNITLWDVRNRNNPQQLSRIFIGDFYDVINDIAFSPDGRILAASVNRLDSPEGSIILWDLTDRNKPQRLGEPFSGHTRVVLDIAFSRDMTLAMGGADGTISLWNMEDPKNPQQLDGLLSGHTEGILSLAFRFDGQVLASGSIDNSIIFWDVLDKNNPRKLAQRTDHTDDVESVTFSQDGQMLASGSNDDSVILWDVSDKNNPQRLDRLTDHKGDVKSVVLSPNKQVLASSSYDKTIILWDVSDKNHPQQIGQSFTDHNDIVQSVSFSPDGDTLASTGGGNTIILWDMKEENKGLRLSQPLIGHSGNIESLAFSPDGKTLASGDSDFLDGTIFLWDVSNWQSPHQLGQKLTNHTGSVKLTFRPNSQVLASADCHDDGVIILWNLINREMPEIFYQTPIGKAGCVRSMAFSPNGRLLASGSDNAIILWEVTDENKLQQLGQPLPETSIVLSVAFSQNNQVLASGKLDHYN